MDDKILELINRRRRQILVHSALYYRFDTSLIDDMTYDAWSNELAKLQEEYPEEAATADYAEDFKDFDGSTGFDLPHANPEITSVAVRLLSYSKSKGAK